MAEEIRPPKGATVARGKDIKKVLLTGATGKERVRETETGERERH